jgi:hypothetical protein
LLFLERLYFCTSIPKLIESFIDCRLDFLYNVIKAIILGAKGSTGSLEATATKYILNRNFLYMPCIPVDHFQKCILINHNIYNICINFLNIFLHINEMMKIKLKFHFTNHCNSCLLTEIIDMDSDAAKYVSMTYDVCLVSYEYLLYFELPAAIPSTN